MYDYILSIVASLPHIGTCNYNIVRCLPIISILVYRSTAIMFAISRSRLSLATRTTVLRRCVRACDSVMRRATSSFAVIVYIMVSSLLPAVLRIAIMRVA